MVRLLHGASFAWRVWRVFCVLLALIIGQQLRF